MEDTQAWIAACESALCRSTGHLGLLRYLAALRPTGEHSAGQCTAIWSAGDLAYRCRTCQLTSASAVCVACFRAGGHEAHDWVQYRSPSGGCCDCGDLSSWREEGCCPAHRPGRAAAPALSALLPPQPRALLEAVLADALARLTEAIERLSTTPPSSTPRATHTAEQQQEQQQQQQQRAQLERAVVSLCVWLQPFASQVALRPLLHGLLTCSLAQFPGCPTLGRAGGDGGGGGAVGTAEELAAEAAAGHLAAGRGAVGRLMPRPPANEGSGQDCLLRRWMLCLSAMPAEPLTQLTSLMLLLLYEPEMKYDSAVHLMASYTPMLSCIAGISGPAGVAAAGAGGRYGSADGSNDQRHPLAVALDRITVQLFNFEEVTNRLVQQAGLLEGQLDALSYLGGAFLTELRRGLGGPEEAGEGGDGEEDTGREEQAGNGLGARLWQRPRGRREASERVLYGLQDAIRRLASDFHTVVFHSGVAKRLLASRELFGERLLGGVLRPMQAMLPHKRIASGPLEERLGPRVTAALQVEYVLNSCVGELVASASGQRGAAGARHGPASGMGPGGTAPASQPQEQQLQRVELLYGGARQALEACEEWCSDRLAREEAAAAAAAAADAADAATGDPGPGQAADDAYVKRRAMYGMYDVYGRLLRAEAGVSSHLPLHRSLGAFLQALLTAEQRGGAAGRLARTRVRQLLQTRASADACGAWRPLSRWPLALQAFVSQIQSRDWVRNGDDVAKVELFVLNGREFIDLDVLVVQAWLASEDPDTAVHDLLAALGGSQLLAAAGLQRRGLGAPPPPPPPASADASEAAATAAAESLRLAVALLRERCAVGLAPRERLRSLLVQWLALRDFTFNQLQDLLPADLHNHPDMESVLAEVATYRAASLSQARQYTLRREAWQLFCPSFIHYTRQMRSRAWEAALAGWSTTTTTATTTTSTTTAASSGNTSVNGGLAAAGAVAGPGTGAGGAAYCPHWQLKRPRGRLPRSLDPMHRVLEAGSTWRVVGWVMQAVLDGPHPPSCPPVGEDALLAALSLLALQLHRAEDNAAQLQQQHRKAPAGSEADAKAERLGEEEEENEGEDLVAAEGARLALAVAVAALAGPERLSREGRELMGKQLWEQQREQQQQWERGEGSEEGAGHLGACGFARHVAVVPELGGRVCGVAAKVDVMLQGGEGGGGGQGAGSGGAGAGAAVRRVQRLVLSPETRDCLVWLQGAMKRVLALCADLWLYEQPVEVQGAAAADGKGGAGVLGLGAGGSGGKGEVGMEGDGAGAAEERRRQLARERQVAMMARLKAQQEAFLAKQRAEAAAAAGAKGGVGAGGRVEEDTDEEESEDGGDGRMVPERSEAAVAGTAAAGAARPEVVLRTAEQVAAEAGNRRGGVEEETEDEEAYDTSDEGEEQEDGSEEEEESEEEGLVPNAVQGGGVAAGVAEAVLLPPPAGRWLPLDLPSAHCAVCHGTEGGGGDGGGGAEHGPLAYIAHVAACACPAVPLQRRRRWDAAPAAPGPDAREDDDAAPDWLCAGVTAGIGGDRGGATRGAWSTSAAPGKAHSAGGVTAAPGESGSSGTEPGTSAAPRTAGPTAIAEPQPRAQRSPADWGAPWRRAWRRHGPCVSEADLATGLHVHCCGHLIHQECHVRLVASQLRAHMAGRAYPGASIVVPEASEFLCPVCRRLANCIMPAAPFEWQGPVAAGQAVAAQVAGGAVERGGGGPASFPVDVGLEIDGEDGESSEGRRSGEEVAAEAASDGTVKGRGREGSVSAQKRAGAELQRLGAVGGSEAGGAAAWGPSSGERGGGEGGAGAWTDAGAGAGAAAGGVGMGVEETRAKLARLSTSSSAAALSLVQQQQQDRQQEQQQVRGVSEVQAEQQEGMVMPVTDNGVQVGRDQGASGGCLSRLDRFLAVLPAVLPYSPPAGAAGESQTRVFDITFGAMREVAPVLLRQVLVEAATHMEQMERAFEVRAGLVARQLLQQREARQQQQHAQQEEEHRAAGQQQQQQQQEEEHHAEGRQQQQQQHAAADQTAAGNTPMQVGDTPTPSQQQEPRAGQGQQHEQEQVHGGSAGTSPGAGPMDSDSLGAEAGDLGGSAGRRAPGAWDEWQGQEQAQGVPWAVAQLLRPDAPPPAPPPLHSYGSKLHEAAVGVSGASVRVKLWGALLHNVAHFEAVRRPRALAQHAPYTAAAAATAAMAGVGARGGGGAAASGQGERAAQGGGPGTPTAHTVAVPAASAALASDGGGGAVTGLPAVEAAHWRAVQSLAAAAVCASGRLCIAGGGDGVGSTAARRQQYTAVQELTSLHASLRWLSCELQTLLPQPGASTQAGGAAAAAAAAVVEAVGTCAGGEHRSQEESEEDEPWLKRGQGKEDTWGPEAPLDFTCCFTPPSRPEVVEAALIKAGTAAMYGNGTGDGGGGSTGVQPLAGGAAAAAAAPAAPGNAWLGWAGRQLVASFRTVAGGGGAGGGGGEAGAAGPGGGAGGEAGGLALKAEDVELVPLRRLSRLADLVADPLLLTVQLLAAGLSGLARSAAPAAAVPALPASPQELLRTVLLAVYPLQVTQCALWLVSSTSSATSSNTAAPAPAHHRQLVQLYGSAVRAFCPSAPYDLLYALGIPTSHRASSSPVHAPTAQQRTGAFAHNSNTNTVAKIESCTEDGATTAAAAAMGPDMLPAAVLPFLVRAYALHCALARQQPDPQLMESYASLPYSPAVQPPADAPATREAKSPAAALAARLAAALGLPPPHVALLEPLRLSCQRAAEAAGVPVRHGATGAGGAVGHGQQQEQLQLQRRVLEHVLCRWSGPHAEVWLTLAAQAAERAASAKVVAEAAVAEAAGVRGSGPGPAWRLPLLPPPSLIPLPRVFQSLFLHLAEAPCRTCGAAPPSSPALCLLTGAPLCALWRGCEGGRGGGLLHAREACAGTCLLLSLRTTRVMALRDSRLAVCQSPYLDAHGDEDPDLRRGRPLFLDPACYTQLSRLWAGAALEFDTQLLHNSRASLLGL